MTTYLLPVFAYLLGSVSSAIVIARLFGLKDPREVGSGNPGATNILRYGGKKAAILTLLGDMLKGAVPVLIAHALGVDWRIPLARAWQEVGYRPAIQGNLDPVALFAPQAELRRRVQEVLNQAAGRHGHIFNLGHGILPDTPVENVRAVVEWVHELSAAQQERTDKSVG